MNRYIKHIIFITVIFSLNIIFLTRICAQNSEVPDRWDLNMIKEAPIWKNLLFNYSLVDYERFWPEQKNCLNKIINEFPKSKWSDDAALLLAGGKASFENDINGAIDELREIIHEYPYGKTIVSHWDENKGCRICDAWLNWTSNLAFLNKDQSIRKSYPFDRDGKIDVMERQVLNYFNHIEKYPNSTVDVAKFIIASMLKAKDDMSSAINKLKILVAEYNLSTINAIDRKAANETDGYYISCEPPFNTKPIWRVQYSVYMALLRFYLLLDKDEDAMKIGQKLVSNISYDGWYWTLNRFLGNIYLKNNQWNDAAKQFNLALQGIQRTVKEQGKWFQALDKDGNFIKPHDFISYENMAFKSRRASILELQSQLLKAQTNK